MSGNIHHSEASNVGSYYLGKVVSSDADVIALGQIEATLALAYEARTANLIALWTDPKQQADEMSGINYGGLAVQIKERLGL